MIQNRTVVKIIDNTGITSVRCFRPRGIIRLGDIVGCSVIKISKGKTNSIKSTFKRGDVIHVLIVNTVSRNGRGFVNNGIRTSFIDNSGIVMQNSGKEGWRPVGSRISGALPRNLRQKGWSNVVSMAEFLILARVS